MQATCVVQVSGFDLMVLTETNFTGQYYCHNRLGYNMVCSLAITTNSGGVQGGVGLVFQDQTKGWSVESTCFHKKNVVSCEIVSGDKRTSLIGAYLLLSTLERLPDLEEALTRFRDQYLMVSGDLNAKIGQSQHPHSQ